MFLSSIINNRRINLAAAGFLLVGGLYLFVSWLFGYVWAGVWNFGFVQNILTIAIGLFFGFIWLGFWLSAKSAAIYWISTLWAITATLILVAHALGQQILPLGTGALDISFGVVAVCLVFLRKPIPHDNPMLGS